MLGRPIARCADTGGHGFFVPLLGHTAVDQLAGVQSEHTALRSRYKRKSAGANARVLRPVHLRVRPATADILTIVAGAGKRDEHGEDMRHAAVAGRNPRLAHALIDVLGQLLKLIVAGATSASLGSFCPCYVVSSGMGVIFDQVDFIALTQRTFV